MVNIGDFNDAGVIAGIGECFTTETSIKIEACFWCVKSIVQLTPELTAQNCFHSILLLTAYELLGTECAACQLQVHNFLFGKSQFSSSASTLTCQSRLVLREHQKTFVHVLGAWCKDTRRDVLRIGAKNFRCCRLGTCFIACCWFWWNCWCFRQLWLRFRQKRRERKNCSRNWSRTSIDNFANVHFDDGVDRSNCDLIACAAANFLFVISSFNGRRFHDAFYNFNCGLHVNFFRF